MVTQELLLLMARTVSGSKAAIVQIVKPVPTQPVYRWSDGEGRLVKLEWTRYGQSSDNAAGVSL